LTAGLLMAPQGIGAALAMPIAGRLTDRVGGGRVALVGVVVMTIATVPYAFIGSATPYGFLAVLLVIRGIGLGSCMMPTMAAAYSLLDRSEIPRATSMLNVARQVGGSIGTALLAVSLQGQIREALSSGGGGGGGTLQRLPESLRVQAAAPLGDAFAHTFGLALAMSTLAIIPVIVLAVTTGKGAPPPAPAAEQARDEDAVAAPA
jgi:MFS family permease